MLVRGDLQLAQPLQLQSALAQAKPLQGAPMIYVPGSSEASSSAPYRFGTMRAAGRVAIRYTTHMVLDLDGHVWVWVGAVQGGPV